MSANAAGDGAKRLGEKLMAEVEVEDLASIFKALREGHCPSTFSNIPELDTLIASSTPPIVELVSPPATHHASGAGKTSLLYLIIAHAILPRSPTLSGHNAAIILFDPLSHFSVPRLAQVMCSLVRASSHRGAPSRSDMQALVSTSLQHVHVFRPPSWPALLSTLHALPDYLFTADKHQSMQRRIHSLVLDDVDAFSSSLRRDPILPTLGIETQNSSLHPPPSSSSCLEIHFTPLTTASAQLAALIARLTSLFSCGALLASRSRSPDAFRPVLPSFWPRHVSATRLAVRRVRVLPFAAGLSVDEAEAERGQRWEVVRRGRFEVSRVGKERGGGGGGGEGFVFRVGDFGVEVEKHEGEREHK
ncbi:hypothetical protein ACEQ8H_005667 [Pleosporales sp. CAS-2024a]